MMSYKHCLTTMSGRNVKNIDAQNNFFQDKMGYLAGHSIKIV